MKAFPGKKCSICKAAIPTGTDIHYDGETKTVQHWACYEEPAEPTVDGLAIANKLGFIESDIVERDSFSEIHRGWRVFLLYPSDRDRPAQPERGDDAARGKQDSLFGMSEAKG